MTLMNFFNSRDFAMQSSSSLKPIACSTSSFWFIFLTEFSTVLLCPCSSQLVCGTRINLLFVTAELTRLPNVGLAFVAHIRINKINKMRKSLWVQKNQKPLKRRIQNFGNWLRRLKQDKRKRSMSKARRNVSTGDPVNPISYFHEINIYFFFLFFFLM